MRALLIVAIVALASSALASDVTIPNEFTGGTTASASEVNANFDAVETGIDDNDARLDLKDSVVYIANPAAAGTTTHGIQEAIDACEDGTAHASADQCIVQLPCSDDTTGLLIDSGLNVTADGITIQGCGSGLSASGAGTFVKWNGSAGGTMLTLTSAQDFKLRDFTLDCDGASNDAGVGISMVVSTGPTQFGAVDQVSVINCTDYAIELGPDGTNSQQVDSIRFSGVRMRGSAGCLKQSSGQSVHNVMQTSECTGATGTGFAIESGEFIINTSFINAEHGETDVKPIVLGELALAHIQDNRFEIDGTTPVLLSTQGTAPNGGGTRDTTTFIGNVVLVQTDSATCFDWDRRGHLLVLGNSFVGGASAVSGTGVDQGCVLTTESTVGGAGNKYLDVHSYGNSHRGLWVAADFGGSLDYSRLPWTAGTDTTIYEDGRIGGSAIATVASNVATATALAANGGNCSAGSYPLGVDASGAVESCTDATTEIDSVIATKSAATSTDNAVPKFDSTAGDVQNSGVLIDDSNNLTVPGGITSGTSGASCLILRDSDDAGDSACEVLNGTFTCETDTNGVCGDAT